MLALHQILDKMSDMVYKDFRLNITKLMTISSLSLNIFTTKFIKDDIYKVGGKVHDDIREAFYGGRVDVFNPEGEGLYQYDVNSLYPFAMLNDIPIGKPRFTNYKNLEEYFGFVYVEIKSPEDLFILTLPYRDSEKMYSLLGNWKGWYFF